MPTYRRLFVPYILKSSTEATPINWIPAWPMRASSLLAEPTSDVGRLPSLFFLQCIKLDLVLVVRTKASDAGRCTKLSSLGLITLLGSLRHSLLCMSFLTNCIRPQAYSTPIRIISYMLSLQCLTHPSIPSSVVRTEEQIRRRRRRESNACRVVSD